MSLEDVKKWIIAEGGVPKHCRDLIPIIVHSADGVWKWSRQFDDKKYDGPTCRPNNRFEWKWTDDIITVTNHISKRGGDTINTKSFQIK